MKMLMNTQMYSLEQQQMKILIKIKLESQSLPQDLKEIQTILNLVAQNPKMILHYNL